MRLFNIKELSHSFGSRKIFETGYEDVKGINKSIFNEAELTVQSGEHIGLVGPNGCGKTTFLKILTGEFVPDSCKIEKPNNLKIGYLDQYADINKNCTVYEYLDSVFDELYKLDKQVTEIYANISELPEEEQIKSVNKAQKILDFLEVKEFYQIEKKIDGVLTGLGFTENDRNKIVTQLSGGMKTKLILAKMLLTDNDILVLDEPTNFLDIKYIAWLGDYLKRLKCAFIVISHDKIFLNKISNKIIEIANRVFKVYNGNYDFYLKEKERLEAVQLQQHIAQSKYIQRSEEYVEAHLYYNTTGAGKTKATWLKKMLENLKRIEKPDEIIKPQFAFKFMRGSSKQIVTLDNIEVGYNNSPVLPPVSLNIQKGEKIVFKGFNGIGKTTLLKSIYGDLPVISGNIEFGDNIETVFLKQEEDYENNFSHFDKAERKALNIKKGKKREITVIEFAKEYYPEKPQKELQAMMLSCGLNEMHFFNQVKTLSGGEMTKLRLCLAMMNPVNLIILDEPTNHLDVYSKEVLMHALDEFDGTVLMTTHDINADVSWATTVINLEDLFS
ncbi:MAG: ATP-binding cassette domain-containing protein [Oscillospiraceae bacterium]|nr:ATP-binding cassette domain-containing protein [Oscillospiraceae bacterium]